YPKKLKHVTDAKQQPRYCSNRENEKSLEYYLQLAAQLLDEDQSHFDVIETLLSQERELNISEKMWILTNKLLEDVDYDNSRSKINFDMNAEKQHSSHMKILGEVQRQVFDMIDINQLFDNAQKSLIALIELDADHSKELLTNHIQYFDVKNIVDTIQSKINEINNSKSYANSGNLNNIVNDNNGNKSNKNINHNHEESAYRIKATPQQKCNYLRFFLVNKLIGSGDGTEHPKFHNLLAYSYIEFDTEKLLKFMSISNSITVVAMLEFIESRLRYVADCRSQITKAKDTNQRLQLDSRFQSKVLDVLDWDQVLNTYEAYCKQLYECYVVLLNRLGRYDESLEIILTKIKDMDKAVTYVQTYGDESLWHKLVDGTLAKAKELVPQLLDAVISHPTRSGRNDFSIDLIQRIPNDMHLPDLKQKLVDLFRGYSIE
ncbi:RING zinc finger-containing protein, partial [Reticulomyxa filosa]